MQPLLAIDFNGYVHTDSSRVKLKTTILKIVYIFKKRKLSFAKLSSGSIAMFQCLAIFEPKD